MNKRLTCIASHVPEGLGLADIGTDHGYLPVELAKRGYTGNLIASDIRPGPLQTAQKSAKEAGLAKQIRVRLGDGISSSYLCHMLPSTFFRLPEVLLRNAGTCI